VRGIDRRAVASRIRKVERERTRYLEAVYHRKTEDVHLYDLVLNTSSLDPASAVNVICLALNHKARRLCAQAGEGGPTAGQSYAPGQPRDFRPPLR
jgi:cytidylate kinase